MIEEIELIPERYRTEFSDQEKAALSRDLKSLEKSPSNHRIISTYGSPQASGSTLHTLSTQKLPNISKSRVTYVNEFKPSVTKRNSTLIKTSVSPISQFFDKNITQLPTGNQVNRYIVDRSPERRNSVNPNKLLKNYEPMVPQSSSTFAHRNSHMTQKPPHLHQRTPSLKDKDVRHLLELYPPTPKAVLKSNTDHQSRIDEAKKMVDDLEQYLNYNNAIKPIKNANL